VRQAFQNLADLGPLPASEALGEQTARQYEEAVKALPPTPTAKEAVALVELLPPDDSAAFGLAWSILHVIEASPAWPVWEVLDDHTVWVRRLRERCERSGLARPD
jgi:hypothetical protein